METKNNSAGKYPRERPRRLRASAPLRRLVQETRISLDQLVMPYFVREGFGVKDPIEAMPGQFRFSNDTILAELEELQDAGVRAILLFGIPEEKDAKASGAWASNGIVQKTVREIKKRFPDLLVITDVCLCAYTDHGHCGILNDKGESENDSSVELLADVALSHEEAGSDMVAPSDMMDGRILAIRKLLDQKNFTQLPILSYAAKYASSFYGPFREAAHSFPNAKVFEGSGNFPADRKSYQMDPSNLKEAMREIALDIEEGADIVMIKPALAYLDVIYEAARQFSHPIAAYSVSGEYAMIKAAAEKGLLDERKAVFEVVTVITRAGASILITYFAKNMALWSREDKSQLFLDNRVKEF